MHDPSRHDPDRPWLACALAQARRGGATRRGRGRAVRLSGIAAVGSILFSALGGSPGGATVAPTLGPALVWLEDQQQTDGGFEVSGFAGFETPDAVLAIGAAGQATEMWSTDEALAAVEGVVAGGPGSADPLDALDDWVDSVQGGPGSVASKAQQAAKVIVTTTVPLGLDATDFDPSGDSADAVDLRAAVTSAEGDGSFPGVTFTGKVYVYWALAGLGETPPPALGSGISAAQQANGAFNFAGDEAGTGFDADITAAVVAAMAVAGETAATSATLRDAIVALALRQRWAGEWAADFDSGNPNSTAMVATAMVALGSHPEDTCWRDVADTRLAGLPQPSPIDALERRQADDGRITSPADGFGVNTFATSQAIQALAAAGSMWPYEPGSACAAAEVTPNRRTVQALYIDLLVRLADVPGADYWTLHFDAGLPSARLAKLFTGTPEYAGRVVERLFQLHLGRAASPSERQAWSPALTAGLRVEVISAILGSAEYLQNSGEWMAPSPETWASAAFLSALGRQASPADVTYVTSLLDAGATRTAIARQLVRSAEGRSAMVTDIYRQLLRRNPSVSDRDYWGGELARGVNPERLVTLIAGSSEYRNSTLA